jgi:hypothetical protein
MRFHRRFVYAANQSILGNSITVKDPKPGLDATKRKITCKAKEKGSSNTVVGNPVLTGGSLFVAANGGTDTSQTYALPQGQSGITGKDFWSGDAAKGFKYKDPKGENGPVKVAQIKKSPSGNFTVKAVITGKNGTISVLPPNPGTDSCCRLDLTGGDTYSVAFLPGNGQVTNKANTLYKHKKPTLEGICVTTTTTTTLLATTTTTSSTTTTTLYGSPSRAFVDRVMGLLD